MLTPKPTTQLKRRTPNAMDTSSQREQRSDGSACIRLPKVESPRSIPTRPPTHRFGVNVGREQVLATYEYKNEVSIGISVDTNFIMELFK